MIRRKPSPLDVAQGFGFVLACVGLYQLVPPGWFCLIVGLCVLAVGVWAEVFVASKRADPAVSTSTPETDGT
jgi:hypothetical protein